jgi:hypothetical protein
MVTFTSDQWIIVALVFVLGLLIGAFLTMGGRRKWKARYVDEVGRREAIEHEHYSEREQWAEREKEWREQDSLRAAAIKENRRDPEAERRDPEAERRDPESERRVADRRVADRSDDSAP